MSIEESSLNDPIKLVTATVSLIDQDNHDINENDHHNPQILHDNKPNTHTTGETSIQPLRESISESIVNMRNENEESERLVWELLQQEAEEAYRMQMEFLRSNANEIGAEDFEVLQALVNEGGIEQESHENLDESTEEEWDYDSLLELGSLLGDVKTERWVKKAKTVISTIPKHLFSQYRKNQVECTASANFLSCSICMEEHKDDDVIMELPCTHCFHEDCVTQWIQENNSCPNCKKKIVASPSK